MEFILTVLKAIGELWLSLLVILGVIAVVIIVIVIPIFAFGCFIEYLLLKPDKYYRDLPKITFKSFYNFYSLSPDSWVLEEDYVEKIAKKETIKFTFKWIEYKKYLRFYNQYNRKLKTIDAKAKLQYNNQQTIKLLEVVQEEINTMKAQSVREIDESAKTMMEIQDRIVGG